MKPTLEDVSKEMLAFVRLNRIRIDRLTELLAQIEQQTKAMAAPEDEGGLHPNSGENTGRF